MGLNRRQRIQQAPQDREKWQKLYYQHQKGYQRRRLVAIKLLWDDLKIIDVSRKLDCNIKTLNRWIDDYLSGGFTELLRPKISGKLGASQLQAYHLRLLKFIILHKNPLDYGFDVYRWTLDLISQLIKDKWGIELKKSQIQNVLVQKLNLSYQKFHRDYANADLAKQRAFASDLNHRLENQQSDEVLLWFDEFSISTRPDASYGWAEKNTHPTIPSNEKKENDIMVF